MTTVSGMTGERDMARAGYRWDVFADFLCNTGGVRVAIRKTKRGAEMTAARFAEANLRFGVEQTYVKLRHDPLLDDAMNRKRRR